MAAHLLEAAAGDIEFKDGKFSVAGTDRGIAMTDVAKAFYRAGRPPTKFGTGLEASGSSAAAAELSQRLPRLRGRGRPARPAWSRSTRYAVVDDCRRA